MCAGAKRDLSAKHYVYFWADGIHVQARLDEDAQCLLVIIGATPEGKKKLVGLIDGVRESAHEAARTCRGTQARGRRRRARLGRRSSKCGRRPALHILSWRVLSPEVPRLGVGNLCEIAQAGGTPVLRRKVPVELRHDCRKNSSWLDRPAWKHLSEANYPISLYYSGEFKQEASNWHIQYLACFKEWMKTAGFEIAKIGGVFQISNSADLGFRG
jgi:hypothetical protein